MSKALPCSPNPSPLQHEADGCGLPASSTGPRRAERGLRGASLAVSSPKEAAKKWALRPPSRAQRRQRRPHGRAMPPMGDASRSELSNPALDAQTQSARPAGPSAHTQQGVQALAAGRRSRRAAPSDGALTSKLRSPSAPTWVLRTKPVASPRELSNPTQSTTRARRLTPNPRRRSSPSRRWRSASRPPRSSARRRRSTATCPRA